MKTKAWRYLVLLSFAFLWISVCAPYARAESEDTIQATLNEACGFAIDLSVFQKTYPRQAGQSLHWESIPSGDYIAIRTGYAGGSISLENTKTEDLRSLSIESVGFFSIKKGEVIWIERCVAIPLKAFIRQYPDQVQNMIERAYGVCLDYFEKEFGLDLLSAGLTNLYGFDDFCHHMDHDMPAGHYLLIPEEKGSAYFGVRSKEGDDDSILFNDFFKGFRIAMFPVDTYVNFDDCVAVSLEELRTSSEEIYQAVISALCADRQKSLDRLCGFSVPLAEFPNLYFVESSVVGKDIPSGKYVFVQEENNYYGVRIYQNRKAEVEWGSLSDWDGTAFVASVKKGWVIGSPTKGTVAIPVKDFDAVCENGSSLIMKANREEQIDNGEWDKALGEVEDED